MLVNIVIPVYSPTLTPNEALSLGQCLQVLGNHPITLVSHRDLDVRVYEQFFLEAGKPFKATYFDSSYFTSVYAYSQLLLSKSFYERFKEFDYLLIYQLDGFVFKDELTEWCSRDFDYIGAPWLKHYGVNYDGNELWKVGNGGVSLRKVKTFLHIFDQHFPFKSTWFFIRNIRKKHFSPMLLRSLRMIGVLSTSRKTVEYVLDSFMDERINEDCFWAEAFQGTKLKLNLPDVLTAARFCLEKKPSEVYRQIGKQLPCFCHAFEKYEYDTFWKDIIEQTRK